MSRYWPSEFLLVTLFAACVCFQLFVPPSIGLANNGDFSKMIGRYSLGPATMDTSEEHRYFTAHWVYDRSFQWLSDDRSSELLPISAAVMIGWWFSNHEFDIRILGAIHAALWIGCFAAFVPLLRRMTRWRRHAMGIAALIVFTDVSYVAHCNSFYTDVAAFLFLAWSVVLWLHWANSGGASTRLFLLFCAAAILCVSSKAQHAALALFWCPLAVTAALSFEGRWRKTWALLPPALILAAGVVSYRLMPAPEKSDDAYAGIFICILHNSPRPLDDLRELGLGPEYLRWVDHWPVPAFDDPSAGREWWNEFNRRTSHARIARFVLIHPWRTVAIVYRTLQNHAPQRRPGLSNYEQKYGFPPGAETKSFGWWSAFRSAWFHVAPWHILVWYLVFLAVTIRMVIGRARIGLLGALLAGMGLTELLISSLADAGEIPRHLFLFHVITDFTILLAVAWAVRFQGKASFRASA